MVVIELVSIFATIGMLRTYIRFLALMKNYLYHIQLFLYRFLLLIVFFTISRLVFYLFNLHYFDTIGVLELLKILFFGIRFDISSLYYFNLLFILLHLVPGNFKNKRIYQNILIIIFIAVNSILLVTNTIDTKFFDFEHKRLTSDIFSSVWIGEDFRTLLPQFIKDYWYLIILWCLMVIGLYKLYPKFKVLKVNNDKICVRTILYQILIFILLMGIGLIFGRGGFQLKPLRVIHAAQYTSSRNIPLVLNTPFTIMKTLGSESLHIQKYFESDDLESIYSPIIYFSSATEKYPNIVLIVMESFSKEYIGALNNTDGFTPFLDSLIDHSLVFTNAFANGKRSIEAMPSIIAGLPALTGNTYITSRYSSNKINSIASILSNKNYYTAFFHGGKNGTMGFDQFAYVSGFDNYYGMDEYPNEMDYDGNWGIYDEEYLQYFGNIISTFKEPFFASVFTLTSHHPYEIPTKYKGKFQEGTLNIHESIGYADYSLKSFFEFAENTLWYNNTLFIIVADHTAQAESQYYNSSLGNYAIPIIFYHPTDSTFRGKSNIIAQQTDIFPTIIDYVGYNEPIVCYGNSLLNDTSEHFTVNYINGIYQIVQDDYLMQFNGNQTISFYDIKTDSLLQNNLINDSANFLEIENKLKAIIQSYQERLIHNKLITK